MGTPVVLAHKDIEMNSKRRRSCYWLYELMQKQRRIKVEPVNKTRLAIGIKTTGGLKLCPAKVEVTAPIPGTVVELEPGASVKKGQPSLFIQPDQLNCT